MKLTPFVGAGDGDGGMRRVKGLRASIHGGPFVCFVNDNLSVDDSASLNWFACTLFFLEETIGI